MSILYKKGFVIAVHNGITRDGAQDLVYGLAGGTRLVRGTIAVDLSAARIEGTDPGSTTGTGSVEGRQTASH
jgi:hypothetical protein